MLAGSLCPLAGPRPFCVTFSHHCVLGFKENKLDIAKKLQSQDLGLSGRSGVHSEFQARKKEGRRKNINPALSKIP